MGRPQVGTFPLPPLVRVSQKDIAGISATDGTTVLNPAVNQYENCFRCHGSSAGKAVRPIYGYLPVRAASAGDPLNIVPQFSHYRLLEPSCYPRQQQLAAAAQPAEYHVESRWHDARGAPWERRFSARTATTATTIASSGAPGPNGPHGSKWTHILERRYEFSQAVAPGQLITNLFRNPDLSVNGPYAMCGKCHSLSSIMTNASFSQHQSHINAGFTCSACHTAHGMGGSNPSISGQRLVNFDVNVVAQNGARPSPTTAPPTLARWRATKSRITRTAQWPRSVRTPPLDGRSEGMNMATATAVEVGIERPASILSKLAYPVALLASLSIWLLALRAPLWLDETLAYWQVSGGFWKIWSRSALMPSSIGYLYTLWAAKSILGSQEIALKIPSTLAMLGAVYFLFRSARELFDQEIAFLVCIFFALESNVVFAATDARPYAFALLATNFAIFAFVRWMTRHEMRQAILFGAAAAGILYFHYLFGAILPAFAIYYLLMRYRFDQGGCAATGGGAGFFYAARSSAGFSRLGSIPHKETHVVQELQHSGVGGAKHARTACRL